VNYDGDPDHQSTSAGKGAGRGLASSFWFGVDRLLHRLAFVVELEKDLSLKKQLLDVIILRRFPGAVPEPLPEGLEELAAYNLITFKSYQETLDDWALKELTGHYVNYRKQVSPSLQQLLPEEEFRLYAVCVRFPRNLATQSTWQEMRPGIYQCRRGTDAIVVVVLRQLPQSAHNAVWHLFSAVPEQVAFGVREYRQHSRETSTLLHRLFEGYKKEGLAMPYTMADFRRDYVKEHLKDLTPDEWLESLPTQEILKALPPEERLKGLPPEERLKGLPPEGRLKGLPPEERLKGLPADERLKGLSAEEIERYLRHLKGNTTLGEGSSSPK
jgi:hypothetical protein